MKADIKLNDAAKEIRQNNAEKGFECSWALMPEKLMLVVTELAEAMEAYRVWFGTSSPGSGVPYQSSHFNEEIADTFIRLLDICGALDIDIEESIQDKVDYNKTRPYKHGKRL